MGEKRHQGRTIVGAFFIGLGAIFLLGSLVPNLVCSSWTLFIIVPGLLMFILAISGNRDAAGLVVPASLVTGTGLILFYQSTTGRWDTWAYAWTLYPVFLGIGLWLLGRLRQEYNTQKAGRGMIIAGTVAFVMFGACFETLTLGRGGGLGRLFWPAILIGLGAWMLIRALDIRMPQDWRLPEEINFPTSTSRPEPPPKPPVFFEKKEEEDDVSEPDDVEEPPAPRKAVKVRVVPGAIPEPPRPPAAPQRPQQALDKAEASAAEAEALARQLNADIDAASALAADIYNLADDQAAVQRDLDDEDDEPQAPGDEDDESNEPKDA
jgi:hypothetical protein